MHSPHLLDLKNKKESSSDLVGPSSLQGKITTEQQTVDKKLAIIIALAFLVLGAVYLGLAKELITAVFFLLLAIVLLALTYKQRPEINWELNSQGLRIDQIFYSYSELHSFWIEFFPHLKELSFRGKKWYHSFIKIPLGTENPLILRDFLLDYLSEEKHEDTIIEIFSRKLGL